MPQGPLAIQSYQLNRILRNLGKRLKPPDSDSIEMFHLLVSYGKFLAQIQGRERKLYYTALNILFLAGKGVYFLLNPNVIPNDISVPDRLFLRADFCENRSEWVKLVLNLRGSFLVNSPYLFPEELAEEIIDCFQSYQEPLVVDQQYRFICVPICPETSLQFLM